MDTKPEIKLVPQEGEEEPKTIKSGDPAKSMPAPATDLEGVVSQALQSALTSIIAQQPTAQGGGGGMGGTQVMGFLIAALFAGGLWLNGQVSEAKALAVASRDTTQELEDRLIELERKTDRANDLAERTISDVRRNTQFLEFLTERLFPGESGMHTGGMK